MLYIGTSGYSYQDWVGPFYPEGLHKSAWLSYYAREFGAVEINYTYYRLPNPSTLAAMADKTPDGFRFAIKASKELTHDRENNDAAFAQYTDALSPLIERDKFGCVLAQFPYSFHATRDNLDYLARFRDRIPRLPIVVEFRNARWLRPETYAFLRETNLGFCCVDEPRLRGLMPPVAEITSEIGYVRFHGRNAAKWWQHEQPYERYDYTYLPEELAEWVPKAGRLVASAEDVYLFANNHWQGQAVTTARQLRLLLDDA